MLLTSARDDNTFAELCNEEDLASQWASDWALELDGVAKNIAQVRLTLALLSPLL